MNLPTRNCPVCDSGEFEQRFDSKDRLNPNESNWRMVICSKCGCNYLNPAPGRDAFPSFYPIEKYDHFIALRNSRNFAEHVQVITRHFFVRWRRRAVESCVHLGKLLDYGSGIGEFLFEMKLRKWEVHGVEPILEAREHAIKTYAVPVFSGLEELVDSGEKDFDAVTFWLSIGHIYRIHPVLTHIQMITKRGASVLVSIPNIESFDARMYGSHWSGWDVPRRINHFRKQELVRLFEQHGFTFVRKIQIPISAFYNATFSEKFRRDASDGGDHNIGPFALLRAMMVAFFTILGGLFHLSWGGSSHIYCFRKATA